MANTSVEQVTSNGSTFLVITTDVGSSTIVDYSVYYGRIADAFERIADSIENIDSHQFNMRNDIHHLRILGDHNGTGIRITTPYAWFTNAYYYKWFIREGHITDNTNDIEDISTAVEYMNRYMGDMANNFPGVYSYGSSDADESPLVTPPHPVP